MAGALENWGEILRTQNLSSDKPMDLVSRWLLITRASVFPMTLISGAIGGLLAVSTPEAPPVNWGYFAMNSLPYCSRASRFCSRVVFGPIV